MAVHVQVTGTPQNGRSDVTETPKLGLRQGKKVCLVCLVVWTYKDYPNGLIWACSVTRVVEHALIEQNRAPHPNWTACTGREPGDSSAQR
jgi:hypothetical protein